MKIVLSESSVQLGKIPDIWYQIRRNSLESVILRNIEIAKTRLEGGVN